MTDEILSQVPGLTIYRTTDWGPPVPYDETPRENSHNWGFKDLRDHPELVAEIPECRKSAGLADLVMSLNEKGSPLMSIGCECRLNRSDAAAYAFYFHSYTDLTFREPSRHATEGQLLALANVIAQGFALKESVPFNMEIGVQRMKHFFGGEGFNLHLGVSGYGKDEAEAIANYEKVAAALAAVFREGFSPKEDKHEPASSTTIVRLLKRVLRVSR